LPQNIFMSRPWREGLGLLLLILLCVGLSVNWLLMTKPANIPDLSANPDPANDYAQAVARIEAMQATEPADMNPLCRLQFLTHGQQVEKAVVFVHGYSNCPHQFRELGQRFYNAGYNVLTVPMPHHGRANRNTSAHKELKAEELAVYADKVVDIAQGLGEEVVMVGLSVGGLATAYAAQYRDDLDYAVLIAPAFGYQPIPAAITPGVMNLLLGQPFDPYLPIAPNNDDLPHGYTRFYLPSLAETLRLSYAIQAEARQNPPAAGRILVITNANDNSVNNHMTAAVVDQWREQGAQLATYEFAKELELEHDLIDPLQSEQRVDIVYPRLVELIME
jgi:pimeloyl-ACP methyl ester carboxylesterase